MKDTELGCGGAGSELLSDQLGSLFPSSSPVQRIKIISAYCIITVNIPVNIPVSCSGVGGLKWCYEMHFHFHWYVSFASNIYFA